MSGPSKKSSGSSARDQQISVDDADVDRFIDLLMTKKEFTDLPSAELAYKLALGKQQVGQMTPGYAEQFAKQVRQRIQWRIPN